MSAYTTVVVGTDGSPTSFAAVERAASVARDSDAELVIVTAFTPSSREDTAAAELELKEDAYQVRGFNPADETLRRAVDKASGVGASRIRTKAVDGSPVDVLRAAVAEHAADLLVVGNRGLNTLSGRLLGSVPADVARRADVDVLIVHTT
ncbi:universal stress protein [Pseudonocardia acidicola]|uniref:Universal stress protein n=1 Tax=Pseudonocardia acidicola TaxID=2724939 RepID=A0ABX1SJ53_9PSEU|nr:universal stress protein [Pseudonocardia acidicola]NMI00543.1 universal stress protein [Pseudonocardia acidicola]